ncbi:MAG: M15 family metallopeptidase [Sphingobacteriia bacterium]|nr:M15 family metallopeptidase [Sphingobacteriia bacterium]
MKYLIKCLSILLILTNIVLANNLPKNFVYLHQLDPSIDQYIEFATNDNPVGAPLDGYEGNQTICTIQAAQAIMKAQKILKKAYPHYSLQIRDAYRPVIAVEHIKRWVNNLDDQETKAKYYPTIDKSEILGKLAAANKSSHSRGSTFDLLIIDTNTNQPLDFGPMYFGDYSAIDYKGLTAKQNNNRQLLRRIMLANGFKPYNAEFWHFTLINEPYPNTYFNFKIRNEK